MKKNISFNRIELERMVVEHYRTRVDIINRCKLPSYFVKHIEFRPFMVLAFLIESVLNETVVKFNL